MIVYQFTRAQTGGGSGTGANNIGIYVSSGKITASASGNLTLNGTGGNTSGNGNVGVLVADAESRIGTSEGLATINGQGRGSGSASACHGVSVSANGLISSEGFGNIVIVGTGGLTSGNQHHGVSVSGTSARILSVSGNISVQGRPGIGSTSRGCVLTGTNSQIAAFTNGNVTLIANSMQIDGSVLTAQNRSTFLRPFTVNTAITLGPTSDVSQGPLNLSDAELDRITTGTLEIGNASSGFIDVTSAITRIATTNMVLTSNNDVRFTSGTISTAGGTMLLDPGTPPVAVKPIVAGNDINASSLSISGNLHIVITSAVQYHALGVVGNVNLNGTTLALSGPHVPQATETFTIVTNDGNDAITGTFTGLPEGSTISNFMNSGLSGAITYQGGTGNDVVISVVFPCDGTIFTAALTPNPLTHIGTGASSTAILETGSEILTVFTITGLNAVLSGNQSNKYIDRVNVWYNDGAIDHLYGTFNGNVVSSVVASIAGPAYSIWVTLEDGLDGNSAVLQSINFSIVTYCDEGLALNSSPIDKVIRTRAQIPAIQSIDASEDMTIDFNAFPNPASESVHVSFQLDKESRCEIELLDLHGRVIRDFTCHATRGKNETELNLRAIGSGVYFLTLSLDGQRVVKILVIE